MRAKTLTENIEFKRGQEPSKSLDIGMTLQRRKNIAIKEFEKLGLKIRGGPFNEDMDVFSFTIIKSFTGGSDSFTIWYVGDNFNPPGPENFPSGGWSVQDINVSPYYAVNGESLEKCIDYVKDRVYKDIMVMEPKYRDLIRNMERIKKAIEEYDN